MYNDHEVFMGPPSTPKTSTYRCMVTPSAYSHFNRSAYNDIIL
jgi:hypothetical protein